MRLVIVLIIIFIEIKINNHLNSLYAASLMKSQEKKT